MNERMKGSEEKPLSSVKNELIKLQEELKLPRQIFVKNLDQRDKDLKKEFLDQIETVYLEPILVVVYDMKDGTKRIQDVEKEEFDKPAMSDYNQRTGTNGIRIKIKKKNGTKFSIFSIPISAPNSSFEMMSAFYYEYRFEEVIIDILKQIQDGKIKEDSDTSRQFKV